MRFWKAFDGLFRRKRSEVMDSGDLPLTRYIFSSREFSKNNERVKPGAFLPYPHRKLSVFQILGLLSRDIWNIGHNLRSDKTLHARADFSGSDVTNISGSRELARNIALEIDNNPERHGDIIGWPEEKPAQKQIAAEFAAKSTLILPT